MVKRRSSAKQRAWRAKFAEMVRSGKWGHKKKAHHVKGRVRTMARRKGGHRKGSKGMGGLAPYLGGIVVGAIGGAFIPKIPIVNQLPSIVQTPVVAYGVGTIAKINPMKMAIGALIGSMLFGGGLGSTATNSKITWFG